MADQVATLPLIADRPYRQDLPSALLLSAASDRRFDHIAAVTRSVVNVPTVAVSLLSDELQVMPGAAGLAEPLASDRCLSLDRSFCRHVVVAAEPLILDDAREHPMFVDNPLVADGVIAYAGVPLTDADGQVVGSLCAIDDRPRAWTEEEISALTELAAACSAEIALRSTIEATARMGERDRIAVELRAEVVRDLIELSLSLSTARARATGEVDELIRVAIEQLDGVLKRIRTAIYPS
jgi:GAF domain-containing protein